MNETDSILTSVKKLLGINEECEEFDADILMNINAAIETLRQIGIGPENGFIVYTKDQVYEDYLGEDKLVVNSVKMYLYYKTRLGFDPPTNSSVLEQLKEAIKETEWRLNVQAETSYI